MRNKRFVLTIVGVTVVSALTAGIAYAVWTTTGSGSGAGAASVAQTLVVTPITPVGAAASLYPGGPAGPVYFTINNPNSFPVTVTGLSWGTPVSTNPTACPNSNISLDTNAPTTVSIPVAANTTSSALSEQSVLDLSHSAPDGCEGTAFDISISATATQS
jgi:hypothetical protein